MRSNDLQLTAEAPDTQTLFQFTYNKNNLFDLIETCPDRKKLFDEYMAWRDRGQQCGWFDIYPTGEWLYKAQCQPDQALVVDIGGGKGDILIRFKDSYPDHPGRLILQDLPSTFQHIDQPPNGIELMEHDFFAPQPVQGMPHQSILTHCVARRGNLTNGSRRVYLPPFPRPSRLARRKVRGDPFQHRPSHGP